MVDALWNELFASCKTWICIRSLIKKSHKITVHDFKGHKMFFKIKIATKFFSEGVGYFKCVGRLSFI